MQKHEELSEVISESSLPLSHHRCVVFSLSQIETNKHTTLTESSGGLCILIHSTDGPFTCRNLWKRFLKPSKSFLDA